MNLHFVQQSMIVGIYNFFDNRSPTSRTHKDKSETMYMFHNVFVVSRKEKEVICAKNMKQYINSNLILKKIKDQVFNIFTNKLY